MTKTLTFTCPHCHHRYEDELELLNAEELHAFQCENCSKPFVLLVKECGSCSEETVFVWPESPPDSVVFQLRCAACGTAYLPSEDPDSDGVL